MQKFNLKDMLKGWFIGNFEPSILKTENFEVGVKHYKKGDVEPLHFHKLSQEVTVVIYGKVKMCNQIFTASEIVVLDPNDSTSFEALEDSCLCVVKHPSVRNDKFLC